jgi:hypothetical protein
MLKWLRRLRQPENPLAASHVLPNLDFWEALTFTVIRKQLK